MLRNTRCQAHRPRLCELGLRQGHDALFVARVTAKATSVNKQEYHTGETVCSEKIDGRAKAVPPRPPRLSPLIPLVGRSSLLPVRTRCCTALIHGPLARVPLQDASLARPSVPLLWPLSLDLMPQVSHFSVVPVYNCSPDLVIYCHIHYLIFLTPPKQAASRMPN